MIFQNQSKMEMIILIFILSLIYVVRSKQLESEARRHFGSVLFIIKYNYKAPLDRLLLHSSFWIKIFEHQLIVVPYDFETLLLARTKVNQGVDVLSCEETDELGYFAYGSITEAMLMYPQYQGYLYAHDDMALNITALMSFNLSSFWITDYDTGNFFIPPAVNLETSWTYRNHSWPWFNMNVGIDALQNVLVKYPIIHDGMLKCTGSDKIWFIGQSDFLYVPQLQTALYIDIMEKMENEQVFLEIAVPTFITCFVPKNIVERVFLCTFWGTDRGNIRHMMEHCKPHTSAFHPVKLSARSSFDFMVKKTDILFDEENVRQKSWITDILQLYGFIKKNDA